jgi:hypothetical protein
MSSLPAKGILLPLKFWLKLPSRKHANARQIDAGMPLLTKERGGWAQVVRYHLVPVVLRIHGSRVRTRHGVSYELYTKYETITYDYDFGTRADHNHNIIFHTIGAAKYQAKS